jgi:hypothetical protein
MVALSSFPFIRWASTLKHPFPNLTGGHSTVGFRNLGEKILCEQYDNDETMNLAIEGGKQAVFQI